MAVAYTGRDVIGDRSAAGGCLDKVCTVYKGVGCGMATVVRNLYDTAQTVTDGIMRYLSFTLNRTQFEYPWKWVKSVCVWFPTSVLRLRTELNGSRRFFLCVPSTRLNLMLVESGSKRSVCDFWPQYSSWVPSLIGRDKLCCADGIAVWEPHRWMPRMLPVAQSGWA